jgi:phage terminase large subunit-like protein
VDTVWFEEASSNKIARSNRQTLLANAELALRARGAVVPELMLTCTPTPDPWLKELVADPGCVTILGSTEENASNLDEDYEDRLRARFGNSRLGRQEVKGEILGDSEGAQLAATCTGRRFRTLPPMKRIALAIDPAISTLRGTDPTGIVGGGRGVDDDLYLFFAREGKWSPREWAETALDAKAAIGAEAIIGERNRGGDLVKSNVQLVAELRAQRKGTIAAVKVVEVYASKNKSKGGRLEELETLGEQGRVHLPEEGLPEYEDQATSWAADSGLPSPNLLDAAGWLAFYLYDGWGEDLVAKQAEATRATFTGFLEAQEVMPVPAWGAPTEEPDAAREWDRV